MKLFRKFIILPLTVLAMAACSKDPKETPADPDAPQIVLLQSPEQWETGKAVEIITEVTIKAGSSISSVTLHYNDGSAKSTTMSAASGANQYSATFTVPSPVGKTAAYYVEAVGSNGKTSKSGTVTLTAVAAGVVDDAASKLRLNEIGTSGDYKFIEIYNPTGLIVSMNGVSLWKNGELLVSFTSSKTMPAKAYGVFRAKESKFTVPAGAVDLGVTETGLSGSKSLSVELRYGGDVIDAFANTVNPGVPQMTSADWDDTPETEGANFIRPKGQTYGWYAAPSTAAATPGKENGSSGTRLKHQLLKEDAVACPPYIANIAINPDKATPTGLTPGDNIIRFKVYYDAHSAEPSVVSSNGNPAKTGGMWYVMPTLSGSAAGTETTITLTASNAAGLTSEKITVLAFAAGTTFGTYSDIRLNEIRTSTKDGIELYNTSSKPVVIAGMRIRKNKDRIFTVPGYMVMKAGGYAVLGCNGKDYSTAGTAYLNLGTVANGLSGSKSLLIELRKPKIEGDLTNSTNIDAFVNIATSVAYPDKNSAWDTENLVQWPITNGAGRAPNGSGAWYLFSTDTMGASNPTTSSGSKFTQTYHQDGTDD